MLRKLLFLLMSVVLVMAGQALLMLPPAQAADTGKTEPQSGKIVSEEPGDNAPNILDGTVYSIVQVGNTIIVGGDFSQVQNYNTSPIITRNNVFAFDATTGKVSTTFAPNPNSIVYKVQEAADGTSVYVAGHFGAAAGKSMPSRLFKADVATGTVDTTFAPPTISGDIRDLEVTGNRLWIAGKFTHINGVQQKALGTLNATTGKRDPYFSGVFAGTHRDITDPRFTADKTNVLQISTNPANDRLVAVGNFTSVNGVSRSQIAQFDIGSASYSMSPWYTTLFTSACSGNFETIMTDVEYSPDGSFFVVSTTAAWGGMSSATGDSGCDVVARFESSSTSSASKATWTAYTGGDTTWTVEVTDNVVYAGGHQSWQNNPIGKNVAGQGAVAREGIAALNPVNGMAYSWNPTRARGVGVQDMLATSAGLYVGSDTTLIGQTDGNKYHARIAFLPLEGGKRTPVISPFTLPGDLYFVASGGSALVRRTHSGTALTSSAPAPSGPGWGTSVGAFMVNGILYKANNNGLLWKQSFDGTTYGNVSPVNSADLLANQTDWHTDVKTITSLFYADGFIYYTKSGTNALYRRGFEIESDVVGQQRFSTTTSGLNWSAVKGAFVANGLLYYADTNGRLLSRTWNQAAHAPASGTGVVRGTSGWNSRTLFPYQGDPGQPNVAPTANITGASCTQLTCSFNGSTSNDWDGDTLTYSWDFGDASPLVTTQNASRTFAAAGAKTVKLTVNDGKGHMDTDTVTVNPVAPPVNVAPTAAITDASCTDLACSFKGETSSDPDGDTLTYSWDFGDTSALVTTQNASRTYTTGGSKTVTLTVSDGNGGSDTDTVTVSPVAPPVNVAPTATITDATCTELTCSFKGQTSSDPDGDTLTYSWDFGDTSALVTTQNASRTYTTEGSKTVTLTVSDGKGGSDTDTVTVNPTAPEPPENAAPTATITDASCTQLTCSFKGETSSDPDGDTLTYKWDFGDTSPEVTTANASRTYASSGAQTVTLTVNDGQGHEDTDTVTVNPTDDGDPESNVTYVGSASSAGNRVNHTVTLPSGVHEGDTMVLFLGAAAIAPTYTGPSGWTPVDGATGSTYMVARAWTKTATAADEAANVKVQVTSSAISKSDLTVAVYRGTDGTPITSSAAKIDNVAGSAHTSPAVTATGNTDWLLTYWVDRSNDATGWLDLVGPTQRVEGAPSDTGNAHITALLADSGGPVSAGAQGELTATANGTGSRGASISILLKSS